MYQWSASHQPWPSTPRRQRLHDVLYGLCSLSASEGVSCSVQSNGEASTALQAA